jgi:hypothetical protein
MLARALYREALELDTLFLNLVTSSKTIPLWLTGARFP